MKKIDGFIERFKKNILEGWVCGVDIANVGESSLVVEYDASQYAFKVSLVPTERPALKFKDHAYDFKCEIFDIPLAELILEKSVRFYIKSGNELVRLNIWDGLPKTLKLAVGSIEQDRNRIVNSLFNAAYPHTISAVIGLLDAKYPQISSVGERLYQRALDIFEQFGIEYYLFAGSMVGYYRDGKQPYWLDDLDVIIMEEDVDKFLEIVVPVFKRAGFDCFPPKKGPEAGIQIVGLWGPGRASSKLKFSDDIEVEVPRVQIDVFFSYVDDNGYLRNCGGWGRYSKVDIPWSWVVPKVNVDIMGRSVPTLRNWKAHVEEIYGDVINSIEVISHNRLFYKNTGMNWNVFDKFMKETYDSASCVPLFDLARGEGLSGGLADLAGRLDSHALGSDFIIADPGSYLWAPDIKKHYPEIDLALFVSDSQYIPMVAHIFDFVDAVICSDSEVQASLVTVLSALCCDYEGKVRLKE